MLFLECVGTHTHMYTLNHRFSHHVVDNAVPLVKWDVSKSYNTHTLTHITYSHMHTHVHTHTHSGRCTSTASRTGCRSRVAMCWKTSGNTSRSSATASETVRLKQGEGSGESLEQFRSYLLEKSSYV